MWNSPQQSSSDGKQYHLEDLSVLVSSLTSILDLPKEIPVSGMVEEAILKPLGHNELLYALYEVFEAMLGNRAVPEKGHSGIHEAIVAELLHEAFCNVRDELESPEMGSLVRRAAWNSVDRLLIRRDPDYLPEVLEAIGMKRSDPEAYLCEALTEDVWHDLLVEEGYLWDEFLWDADWRMGSLMDAGPESSAAVCLLTGIDLDVVQRLPYTPSDTELQMAEHYLQYVRWKDEVIHGWGNLS